MLGRKGQVFGNSLKQYVARSERRKILYKLMAKIVKECAEVMNPVLFAVLMSQVYKRRPNPDE